MNNFLFMCELCNSREAINFTRVINQLPKRLQEEAKNKTNCLSKKYISVCLKCENQIRLIEKKEPIEKVCPYCYINIGSDDASYQCSSSPMIPLKIQGSRGLRIDNLKKWENSGINIKKLPNSEWHRESYVRMDWECANCYYREYGEEMPTILVSDDPFLLEGGTQNAI